MPATSFNPFYRISELGLLGGALGTAMYQIHFVRSAKVFHVTIRQMLVNESCGNCVYVILKVVTTMYMLVAPKWLPLSVDALMYGAYLVFSLFPVYNSIMILIERICSTCMIGKYEFFENAYYSVMMNTLPWVFALVHSCFCATVSNPTVIFVPLMYIELLTLGGFFFIGVMNKLNYNKPARGKAMPTLTERFQTRENINVANFMKRRVGFRIATHFIYTAVICTYQKQMSETIEECMNIAQAFKLLIEPFVLYMSSPAFRGKPQQQPMQPPKEDKNPTQLHFESLMMQWNN